jgi:GTP-binding protein
LKFIDEAIIKVASGNGGPGSTHFRREKFIPRGGPDGGNGGKGGSVYVRGTKDKNSLLDFRFRPIWRAGNGGSGGPARKDGKSGDDVIILLPVGTEVIRLSDDLSEEEVVVDITSESEFLLLQGGRGGKGNDFFKTSTNQAPTYAQPGESGVEASFKLKLKLIADVGLIGFPNAGKSTLISRISAARPVIADYPFTTLAPQLGVVQSYDGRSFIVADIPGLIPDAHLGKGLGIGFLKATERTKLILHLIDVSGPLGFSDSLEDFIAGYLSIRRELEAFSESLSIKPEIIVLNKIDLLGEDSDKSVSKVAEALSPFFSKATIGICGISSVSGKGIDELLTLTDKELFLRNSALDGGAGGAINNCVILAEDDSSHAAITPSSKFSTEP